MDVGQTGIQAGIQVGFRHSEDILTIGVAHRDHR